jgi:hypothetical protein
VAPSLHGLDMATKLNDYIAQVRSGYDDEQRARLDGEMRRFDLAGQLLALRLAADITQAELAKRSGFTLKEAQKSSCPHKGLPVSMNTGCRSKSGPQGTRSCVSGKWIWT